MDTRRRKLKSKEAEDLSTKKETEVLGTRGGKSEGSHKEEDNTTKVDVKTKKDDQKSKKEDERLLMIIKEKAMEEDKNDLNISTDKCNEPETCLEENGAG